MIDNEMQLEAIKPLDRGFGSRFAIPANTLLRLEQATKA